MSAAKRIRRRSRAGSSTLALKVTIGLLVVALAGVCVMAYFSFDNLKMMQATVDVDRIHNSVFINEVDVGGLTKDEALVKLKREFIPKLQEETVTVSAEGKDLVMSFGDFSARLDFSESVILAYDYARSGSLKERYELVTALETTPHKISVEPEYSYDGSSIVQKLQPLSDHVNIEFINSNLSRRNGIFEVSEARVGRVLDVEKTKTLIEEVLDTRKSGTITAVVDIIQPQVVPEDFNRAQSLIGSFVTTITPGNNGRNMNITSALANINDVVLHPGEIFSTNKHFGAMTYDNGYRPAPVIQGGKLVDDMGGGVCQVSSTLYNAVLNAELEIVERRNHSLKVSYVDYGFDATLAGDYIDFKFKNNTDYPVFVEAMLVDGKSVTVNLYGYEIHDPSRRLVFEKSLVETIQPQEEIVTEDASLPLGTRIEKTKPLQGYRYKVFKTVYEHDKEIAKVLVNTSYYIPTRGETVVGTGTMSDSNTTADASTGTPPTELPVTDATEMPVEADPAPIQPEDEAPLEDEAPPEDTQ